RRPRHREPGGPGGGGDGSGKHPPAGGERALRPTHPAAGAALRRGLQQAPVLYPALHLPVALMRWAGLMLAALLCLASAAQAQVPPPPYAYVRGTDPGRDTVSTSKFQIVPKNKGDTLLRANFRNLGYYQGRPGWGIYIKYLILRTTNGP